MGGLNSGPGPGIFLLIAIVFFLAQDASSAPLYEDDENDDGNSQAISQSNGCYYNFRYYSEGERIITNEPCLNCTCRNRMFMCYLRVCPFTKGVGQNCTIEKVPGQCCPIITCPEVPVHLLTSSSTTELSEGSKGSEIHQENVIGHFGGNGCHIEGIFYPNGAQVPGSSEKPCELCYCIRNKTSCIMQTCALHVEGCRPVYEEGQCFPVRYQCDDSAYQEPEPTTTYRPPPATGLLLTTTSSEILECTHNNEVYEDGARIQTDDPCEHCYCLKGKIACAIQECGIPLEKEGQNCTALPAPPGKCCPDSYQCDVTMTSPDVNLSSEGLIYTTKPTFHNFDGVFGSIAGTASNQDKKHPEENLKPHDTDKKTQTLMQNSVPNENISEMFPNNLSIKPSLTTHTYDNIYGKHPNLEKNTEKYETSQNSQLGHLHPEYVTHPTSTFESGNNFLKPNNGLKESSLDKDSIKETELTQKNESSPDVGLSQNLNFVSEKLPVLKDKNPQQQISSSQTNDRDKTTKPEVSDEITQPSKVNAGHYVTLATENNSNFTKPASQIKDDSLLNKLHNIIQDVQAQVNEGKTTSIPEVADYGITLSNQKGHFTDKPDSLTHTMQTDEDTQLFYGDDKTSRPTENYGYSEIESTQNNNDIFNKLPGHIHNIYEQITSTQQQQETSSKPVNQSSLAPSEGHSVNQPSSDHKISQLPNEGTSKYPYQPDIKEQTTEYQTSATQDVVTEKDESSSSTKPPHVYNTQNPVKINLMENNKQPSYENIESTSGIVTTDIFKGTTRTTVPHYYLPSENMHKDFNKLNSNNISNKPPPGLENTIYSTSYNFEDATDVAFELNTKKNLSVPNSSEYDPSSNSISSTTTKSSQKKKPSYSQGMEQLDDTKVTSQSEDSTREPFPVNSESQKYGNHYPNKETTEISGNFNKKPGSQKRKPAKPFGQNPEINYTGEEEPDYSTPNNLYSETGSVETEEVTFKPNPHKPATKYPHTESAQNSEFYPEGFTESLLPTNSEEYFPHTDNLGAYIKRKPETSTANYIKPQRPEHFPDSSEIEKEKYTTKPHDNYSGENNFQGSSKPNQNTDKTETSILNSGDKMQYAHRPTAESDGITFGNYDPTEYSTVPASTYETGHFNKDSSTPTVTQKYPLHNTGYFENPNEYDPNTKHPYGQSTVDSPENTENMKQNFFGTTEYIKDLTGQSQGQPIKKPFPEGSEYPHETWESTSLKNPTKVNQNDNKNSDVKPFNKRPSVSNAAELEKEIEDAFTNLPAVTQYTTSDYTDDISKPENFSGNHGKLPSVNIHQQTSQKYPHTSHQTTRKPGFPTESPNDFSTLIFEDHSTPSKLNTENLDAATLNEYPSDKNQLEEVKPGKPEKIGEQSHPQKKRPELRPEETEKTESLENYEMTEMPGVSTQNLHQHLGNTDKPHTSDEGPLISDHRPGTNLQQTHADTSLTDEQPVFLTISPSNEPVENEVSSSEKKPEHDVPLLNQKIPTTKTSTAGLFGVSTSTEHTETEEIFENVKEVTTSSNNFFQNEEYPSETGATKITGTSSKYPSQFEIEQHKKGPNQHKPTTISSYDIATHDYSQKEQTDKTTENVFQIEQTTYAYPFSFEGSTTIGGNYEINEHTTREKITSTQINEFYTEVPPVQISPQTNLTNSELYPSKRRPVKPSHVPTDIKIAEEAHQTTDPDKYFPINQSDKIFKQPDNETGINYSQRPDYLGLISSSHLPNEFTTQDYATDYQTQKTTQNPDNIFGTSSRPKEKPEKTQEMNNFEDNTEETEKSPADLNLLSENDASTAVTQKKFKPLTTTEPGITKSSEYTKPIKTEVGIQQQITDYLFASNHKEAEHSHFQTTEPLNEYFTDNTDIPLIGIDFINQQEKQPNSTQVGADEDSKYITTASISSETEETHPENEQVTMNKPAKYPAHSEFNPSKFDTSSTTIPSSLEQDISNTGHPEEIVTEKTGENFSTRNPEDSDDKHPSNIQPHFDHSGKPGYHTNKYEESSSDATRKPYVPSHSSSLDPNKEFTASNENFESTYPTSSTLDYANKDSYSSPNQEKENFKEPLTGETTTKLSKPMFSPDLLELSTHKTEFFLTEDPGRIPTTKSQNVEVLTEIQSIGNSPDSEDLIDETTHYSSTQDLNGITEPSKKPVSTSSTKKQSSSYHDSTFPGNLITVSTERFQLNKIEESSTPFDYSETANDPLKSTYSPEESVTKISDTEPLKFSTPKVGAHNDENLSGEISEKKTTQLPHLEFGNSEPVNFPWQTSQQTSSAFDDSKPITTESSNEKFTSTDRPLKLPIDDSTDLEGSLSEAQTTPPSIYENDHQNVSTNKIVISSTEPDKQSDDLEEKTGSAPKPSSALMHQPNSPASEGKPGTHIQGATDTNQKIPEDSSTVNFDMSSVSKFSSKPDQTFDTTAQTGKIITTTIKADLNQNFEKSSTEINFPQKISDGDDLINKLHGIIQEIQTQKTDEGLLKPTSKIPYTDLFSVDTETPLETTSEELIYEEYTNTPLTTDSNLKDSSKSPNTRPSESQFENPDVQSSAESEEFLTSTENFKYPEQSTTFGVKEESVHSEVPTFKPDDLNKLSEFGTDKHRPSNKEKPQTQPLDIVDQTTTPNLVSSAFTTKLPHTYTSKNEHPSGVKDGTLTSTESYEKNTLPSSTSSHNQHEVITTATSLTERPENKFTVTHFNKITPTDNNGSLSTVVVTPNVGSFEEPVQHGSTNNPIHLVYPTYYPDGILPHKPITEYTKDQSNNILDETSDSSLDYGSQTMKTTEFPEVESITEQKNTIHQTEYTSYEIQTEISSESITGRPIVIVEEIKTEVHIEKPTTKPSFVPQENISEAELSTEHLPHEFSSNKISGAEENFTEKANQTQLHPSNEQISSQSHVITEKPENENVKLTEKPNFFEDPKKTAGTDYPFTQVTDILVHHSQHTIKDDHVMHLYPQKNKYKKTTTPSYQPINTNTQTESPKQTFTPEISTDSLVTITTINDPSEENKKIQSSSQAGNNQQSYPHHVLEPKFPVRKTTLRPAEIEQELIKTTSTMEHSTSQASQNTEFYPEKEISTDKPSSVSPVLGMYVPYKIINNTKVYFTEDQPDNKDYDGLDYVPFEIVDGKKVFHTDRVTPFPTTTSQSHAGHGQGVYIPYKVINGSRVFFPEDAQEDFINIDKKYDGYQYIPHKLVSENIQGTTTNISSPHFQAVYVPFKVRNNTKVYYPKDSEEKPLTNLKDYDGFDYVPYEIENGIKVFYPEKGIPSYLTENSIPHTTTTPQNYISQNYQSNYVPNSGSSPNKLVTEKLPSQFPDSAMFVPFKLISGTKVLYVAEAQHKPDEVAEGYDGVEYIPYELKNGTKVFQPNQVPSKPLQAIFVPYKNVNHSKIFYPMDSSHKPIHLLPNKYDGVDSFLYENKNGTDVFYSIPNKPIEESETKGMFLPYKIINGSKVYYPEDAKYQSQFIPDEYDGYEFTPYEVKNGTKIFYPTNKKETNKPFINELNSNGMYVPYKMVNNTKVYYVSEAQNRPHPLSDEYHGLDYLPYEVTNNTENNNKKPENVAMYVPFNLINGSKVHYPSDAQKEPQHLSNQYDGHDYILFDNLQNNVAFHNQDASTSTTTQSVFKPALYVPYKITNGTKIFHPKDAKDNPELIPHEYDGFEYIPYEIIDDKKVFHPEEATAVTTKPIVYPHSLYVPYKNINGTKVYYPNLATNRPAEISHGYDGVDSIPYEIVDGKKIFHPEQIIRTPSTISPIVTTLSPQLPFTTTSETIVNALHVPFRIINDTKVFYPKDAQDKPQNIPHEYDGFEYVPYEVVDGKKVFHPELASQISTKPTPSTQPMYIPYKIHDGTKTYYPALAKLKPEKIPEGYDGADYIPLDELNKHKVSYPEGYDKVPTTPSNFIYTFVPYKWDNGTKVFYPKDAQDKPQNIPHEYDGFEYVPYEVVDGKKVFYSELAIEYPSQSSIPFIDGIYVPYKISNETKIFYPVDAHKSSKIPTGYEGVEYVPYEIINGTKIFYPELITAPLPGVLQVYVPYKMLNGKKIFYPEAASTEPPVNVHTLYDGVARVSYKSHSHRPEKPSFGTNSEVIYVSDEEGLKTPPIYDNQYTNYSIPGEGNCLINNRTYNDNSEIPSFSPCQIKCKCTNSIVRCVRVKCPSLQQGIEKNCSPVYKEDSCCPTYDCAENLGRPTTVTPGHIFTEQTKQDSYMTTEIPLKKPSFEAGNDSAKKPFDKDNQYVQKLPKPDSMDPYDNVEGLVSGEATPDDEYGDDDEPYGPGTCRYAGKIYVSAQQIPRDDPCDFCFCFRSDIICLQQSCPPPIPGCRDEPIQGFCCPRYECHVKMATLLNVTSTTTTTTTTLPPHFFSHAYKGSASRTGCFVQGRAYRVGQAIPSASGPCMDCICGGNGRMKCEPKVCAPEPLIRKMVVPTETTPSSLKKR